MRGVLCDDCDKWRRIPATLADQIDEKNCKWTCKDNNDKDFADCSIPQEKSNAEINEELEISDGSCEDDARGAFLKSNPNQSTASQQSS
ncbi:histone-lysine N-methyltransferase ASHH2 [Olea europaea subsp. europaea]|uniref:Histone-lysine N-methyltransferase ASHH2 n=1 Tax=Olea europaea subsp. europaea TaxID=158383 RepID=A0A8S0UHN0_OLEEU|nr:histone-lysine N-methyltransferase ASHH2 [Olea europaea subsp. europaea]